MSNRFLIVSSVLLLGIGSVICGATKDDAQESDEPKSPQAKAAVEKLDRSLIKADADYQAAIAAARRQVLKDLDAALDTAMKNHNSDEVVRIRDKQKQFRGGEKDASSAKSPPKDEGDLWHGSWGDFNLLFPDGRAMQIARDGTNKGKWERQGDSLSIMLDNKAIDTFDFSTLKDGRVSGKGKGGKIAMNYVGHLQLAPMYVKSLEKE